MGTPSIGRIVHYTNGSGTFPAVITKVWNPTLVNLEVFGLYDVQDRIKTSVVQGSENQVGTWFWPPRV